MVLSCLPGALQAVQLILSCLPGASLVPPRLSKWFVPASLVLPWCLAGCPMDPFLPPWFRRRFQRQSCATRALLKAILCYERALKANPVLREGLSRLSCATTTQSLQEETRQSTGLGVKGNSFIVSTHSERSTLSCKGLGELVIDTSSPPLAGGTGSTRGRAPGARLWFRV